MLASLSLLLCSRLPRGTASERWASPEEDASAFRIFRRLGVVLAVVLGAFCPREALAQFSNVAGSSAEPNPGSSPTAQTSLATAATDPRTTIYGLFWWPPGTSRGLEYYDRSRPADSTPLPIGTTGDVALSWDVVAWGGPQADSTWTVTFTDPSGFQYVYEHTLTVSEYYPGSGYWEACFSVVSWTTSDPVHRAGDRDCHYMFTNGGSTWNILTGLIYPCKPITTWDVQMVGAASFSGMLNMVSDGIGAVDLAAPATLAPAIPASAGGTSIFEPAIGPESGQLTVTVFDTLCPTVPVPNTPVQVQFTYVAGSGGHTHNPPPNLSDIFQSVLMITPQGSATFNASQALLSGTTVSDGTVRAALVPGLATADFTATASSPAGGTPSSGWIALDPGLGLAPVAAQPGLFFLSGGAGQQCGNQGWCDNHTDNHYLSPAVLPRVQAFATSVSQRTNGRILVGLDDMSLVRGGIFDLNGDFQPSHFLHRQGHDVDIAWVQVVNTGAFVSSHVYEEDIQRAAMSAGGKRVIEGPIHFRFPY